MRPRALPGEGAHRRVALHVLLAPPRLPAIAKPGMNHDALARSKYVLVKLSHNDFDTPPLT